MKFQAKIPAGMAAIHNFIRKFDPEEILDFSDILDDIPSMDTFGELAAGQAGRAERVRATEAR
jgi:hypothetical protein